MKYESLRNWKYRTTDTLSITLSKEFNNCFQGKDQHTDYLELSWKQDQKRWQLLIHAHYAWDGASGLAIDTSTNMLGSLVHDALYALIRARRLPYECKLAADNEYYNVCIDNGMSKFRATLHWIGIRLFGGLVL